MVPVKHMDVMAHTKCTVPQWRRHVPCQICGLLASAGQSGGEFRAGIVRLCRAVMIGRMNVTCDFTVAIPARFASSRLPGKPLRRLGGEPLVLHVARRALAAGAREVWVATDDVRIANALAGLDGIRVAMTSPGHHSGSDRLAECVDIAGWGDDAIVVNLQGDEPFAPVAGIRAVAALVRDGCAQMATLATPVQTREELFDPNAVKVVRAASGRALYFSRAPLPWPRDQTAEPVFPGGAVGAGGVAGTIARAGSRTRHRRGIDPGAVPARCGYAGGYGARGSVFTARTGAR